MPAYPPASYKRAASATSLATIHEHHELGITPECLLTEFISRTPASAPARQLVYDWSCTIAAPTRLPEVGPPAMASGPEGMTRNGQALSGRPQKYKISAETWPFPSNLACKEDTPESAEKLPSLVPEMSDDGSRKASSDDGVKTPAPGDMDGDLTIVSPVETTSAYYSFPTTTAISRSSLEIDPAPPLSHVSAPSEPKPLAQRPGESLEYPFPRLVPAPAPGPPKGGARAQAATEPVRTIKFGGEKRNIPADPLSHPADNKKQKTSFFWGGMNALRRRSSLKRRAESELPSCPGNPDCLPEKLCQGNEACVNRFAALLAANLRSLETYAKELEEDGEEDEAARKKKVERGQRPKLWFLNNRQSTVTDLRERQQSTVELVRSGEVMTSVIVSDMGCEEGEGDSDGDSPGVRRKDGMEEGVREEGGQKKRWRKWYTVFTNPKLRRKVIVTRNEETTLSE
jgi:hypothetical protein